MTELTPILAQEPEQAFAMVKAQAEAVFLDPNGLTPLVERIAAEVDAYQPDLSTATSRKAIASFAYKVTRSKTFVDDLGKALVAEMKARPTRVDESRRKWREKLDALALKARQPLTDWEEAEARKEAERVAELRRLELQKQLDRDHELALFMDQAWEAQQEAAALAAIKAQEERDEALRQEGARKALEASQPPPAPIVARPGFDQQVRVEDGPYLGSMIEDPAVTAPPVKMLAAAVDAAVSIPEDPRKKLARECLDDLLPFVGGDEDMGKAIIRAVANGRIRHLSCSI